MKRIVVFALVLNAALLGVIAHQLVAIAGGGAVPTADRNGDVNGDARLDMSDAIYLLLHIFRNGPQPVALADSPEVLDRVSALESAFVGTVSAYAGTSDNLPGGWLLCDGSVVSRDEYPRLFAAIGTAHGGEDGATTFNLPDYRGMFLRGVDNGAERDPDGEDRTVGSIQDFAIETHGHEIDDPGHDHVHLLTEGGGNPLLNQRPRWYYRAGVEMEYPGESATTGITVTTPTGVNVASETRPVNSAVNYMIKY